MKKKIVIFLLSIIIFLTGCSSSENSNGNFTSSLVSALRPEVSSQPSSIATPVNSPIITPTKNYPNTLNYPVPFTSQAPYAIWDDLHNEACEEASMIMVDSFLNKKELFKEIAEQKIQELVKWQSENGYTVDVTAKEVIKILKDYYTIEAKLSFASVDNIIKTLNEGKIIIVPAAGRELKNPNYKRPGPLYHMLVVRGYDSLKKEFITNDPGTRKGEGYRYKYDIFLNAIHDWPKQGKGKDDVTEEEMNSGQKVMIVISL